MWVTAHRQHHCRVEGGCSSWWGAEVGTRQSGHDTVVNIFTCYCYSIFVCVLHKVENELFVCYTLGKMADILIQGALMIADTSVNIN